MVWRHRRFYIVLCSPLADTHRWFRVSVGFKWIFMLLRQWKRFKSEDWQIKIDNRVITKKKCEPTNKQNGKKWKIQTKPDTAAKTTKRTSINMDFCLQCFSVLRCVLLDKLYSHSIKIYYIHFICRMPCAFSAILLFSSIELIICYRLLLLWKHFHALLICRMCWAVPYARLYIYA